MPATNDEDERIKSQLQQIQLQMFWGMATLTIGSASVARSTQIIEICGGDAGRAGQILGRLSSMGAGVEFLINPVLGRLSDKIGRRPFFFLGPGSHAVLKLLTFMNPGSLYQTSAEHVVCKACSTLSQTTACSAAITDVLRDRLDSKDEAVAAAAKRTMSAEFAKMGSMAGLGVIVGPLLAGRVMKAFGSFRHAFLLGAASGMAQLLYVYLFVKETLPLARRKPFDISSVNPLSFTRLFTGTPALRKLAIVGALQCFAEGKNTVAVEQVYLKADAKWTPDNINNFATAVGAAMVGGGKMAAMWMQRLGSRRFASMANLVTALNYLIVWVGLGASMGKRWAPLAFMAIQCVTGAINGGALSPIKSLMTAQALSSGMGSGEFSGAWGNFRALVSTSAPMLYGNMYRTATTGGRAMPGAPFAFIAAAALAAEAMHSTISEHELKRKA